MTTYSDPDYAYSRLSGTVVMYQGCPHMVHRVTSEMNVLLTKTPSDTIVEVPLSNVDLVPPRLGYINLARKVSYLIRSPARQWKQGLRMSQLRGVGLSGLRVDCPEMINMMMNRYPPIQEVMDAIDCGECASKAFNYDFALGQKQSAGFQLFFKGNRVGHIVDSTTQNVNFVLAERYQFLRESLEQIIVGNHANN